MKQINIYNKKDGVLTMTFDLDLNTNKIENIRMNLFGLQPNDDFYGESIEVN